jgi:hypothetical protein
MTNLIDYWICKHHDQPINFIDPDIRRAFFALGEILIG